MLELKNLTKKFRDKLIVTNMSIKLEDGIYKLKGENGSGKSTILKMIAGLDEHYSGSIRLYGNSVFYLPEKLILPKSMNITEFIYSFMNITEASESINYFLNRYKLPDISIKKISKGMTQKVGLIIMLMSNCDILLLDEPLEGLDEDSVKLLEEDLLKMHNKIIIISEHKNRSLSLKNSQIIDIMEYKNEKAL